MEQNRGSSIAAHPGRPQCCPIQSSQDSRSKGTAIRTLLASFTKSANLPRPCRLDPDTHSRSTLASWPWREPAPPVQALSCPPPNRHLKVVPWRPRPLVLPAVPLRQGCALPCSLRQRAHRDPTSMPAQAGNAISSKPAIDPRPPQQPLCAAFLLELPGRYAHPSSPVMRVASEPGPLGRAMPLTRIEGARKS
jgi:hypothetical protein